MSDMSDLKCSGCGAPLERMRYFPRQLLTADDLTVEQDYYRQKLRLHNRYLHGWGVVCGCSVEPVDGASGLQVRVLPGYVVSPPGDEILIDRPVEVDLQRGVQDPPCEVRWPCPPPGAISTSEDGSVTAYLAVRYAECHSRPLRVHPAGCGCDETSCEYSRVRESFEIKVLWELPSSHVQAARDAQQWCRTLEQASSDDPKKTLSFPVPACPECEMDPWVVLATIALPGKRGPSSSAAEASDALRISYKDRQVLLPTQRLQTAVACLLD